MKTQHTPGPWEMSRDAVPPGHVQITIYEPGGKRVATAFEAEANARLIAAAPDLLEACEAYVSIYGHRQEHNGGHAMKLARAAIDKATN